MMPDGEAGRSDENPGHAACVEGAVPRIRPARRALLALALLLASVSAPGAPPAAPKRSDPIRAALEKGDPEAAVAAADAALKSSPKDTDVLLWAGRAYGQRTMSASIFSKMSLAKKCRESWETAVAIDPAFLDARSELLRFYLIAPGIAGGSVEKAREQASRIAAVDATQGHVARGRIAEHEKDLAGAEAAYRKAAEGDPQGTTGPVALASFYAGQKRWPEARAIFEKRLAADPGDAIAVYQLGRIALFSGEEMEKGAALFDRYLSLPVPEDGPTHADARWRKGLLLEKLGRTPAAIAEYREALKIDPAHRGAKKELERLKAA
jgi:tetratricopeptide (TPR) repeat protein